MTWKALPTPGPNDTLVAIGGAITTGLRSLQGALETARATAATNTAEFSALELDSVDTFGTALRLILDGAKTALDDILDNLGGYILPIPIPKKGLAALISRPTNSAEAGSNYLRVPTNVVLGSLSPRARTTLSSSPAFSRIVGAESTDLGGNAYVLKTIMDALFDSGDQNRPRLTAQSEWAYVLIVGGATDVTQVLKLGHFFDSFIGQYRNASSVGASRGITAITPQNLRVEASARGNQPLIRWDPIPVSVALSSYDGTKVLPKRYALIRSTGIQARGATRVEDLFSTRSLTQGLTGLYGAKVLKVGVYDGVVDRLFDGESLTPGKTYYYHVAFDCDLQPSRFSSRESQTSTPIGFSHLSSAAPYAVPRTRSELNRGSVSKAPDWGRTPSVAAMVPGLERVVGYVQDLLATMSAASETLELRNEGYVQFINNEITKLTTKIAELEALAARLASTYDIADLGAAMTFRRGSGAAGELIADVAAALNDFEDPERPDFDTGDEYVVGMLMLIEGPSGAAFTKAAGLLEALFVPPDVDPALDGINAVSTQLATIEETLLQTLGADTASVTFNADLTPRPAGSGDSSCD